MKGNWIIPFDENGNMIENKFIEMKPIIKAFTGEIAYAESGVAVPLHVWEKMAFDNKPIEAIDAEWWELEPTPAAREENEYGEVYSWLLSRFESKQ